MPLILVSSQTLAAIVPYAWVSSEPVLQVANRATIRLEVCDDRRFAWQPISLPRHPGLMTRLVAERAIEKNHQGDSCVGTEWVWQVMPSRAGVIDLGAMMLQSNQFGRVVDVSIQGPKLRVGAPPSWLPPWVASHRPQRFEWLDGEGSDSLPVVQHSLVLRSSLSRPQVEEWLALVLEDQPAWSVLPPLIEPMSESLGDEFKITVYAPRQPPEVPALWLQMKAFDPASQALQTLVLEKPALPIEGEVERTLPRWMTHWMTLYQLGTAWVPLASLGALIVVFLMVMRQKHAWRVQRWILTVRLARARSPHQVWELLRKGPWPVLAQAGWTPRQWAERVSRDVPDEGAQTQTIDLMTQLDQLLFGQPSQPAQEETRALAGKLIQLLKHPSWKHPGDQTAHQR